MDNLPDDSTTLPDVLTMALLQPAQHEVLISLGRSTPGDGGIFEFSSQLAQRIAQVAPVWREKLSVGFTFHLRPELQGRFGDAVGYLPLRRTDRWWLDAGRPISLWHSVHQMNKSRPPRGCRQRLLTIHDLNYLYGRPPFSVWRHNRQLLAMLGRTEHVTAVSHHTAADVRRVLDWRGSLDVIHNGARNLSGDEQQPLFEPDRPFLFHLSRMSPSKNPQALLAMAAIWPEMDFVFCGPHSGDAQALAAAPKPSNVRFFLGISDAQKTWAYARCAGFLFPSLAEGFGLPPIEAMHFGRPVFLARRTCLPEIGGEAAHYFDDFDPWSMRRTVERGLAAGSDPVQIDAVRAHAAQFDWDRSASRYLDIYRRLLNLPVLAH